MSDCASFAPAGSDAGLLEVGRHFDAAGDGTFLAIGRDNTFRRMASHVTHIGVHDHGFNNVSTYGNLRRLMLEGRIPHDDRELAFYELALKASGAVQGDGPDMMLIQVLVHFEQVTFIICPSGQGLAYWRKFIACDDYDRPMNAYGIANIPVLITCLNRCIDHRIGLSLYVCVL